MTGFNIEEVAVSESSVTLDFPDVNKATITIARISADTLQDIRKKSVTGKMMDFATKQFIDKIDDEKFLRLYSDVVIIDWTGLKAKHLKELMLCRIPADQEETVVLPTADNKYMLMAKSPTIDSFISSTLQSVALFNEEMEAAEVKK